MRIGRIPSLLIQLRSEVMAKHKLLSSSSINKKVVENIILEFSPFCESANPSEIENGIKELIITTSKEDKKRIQCICKSMSIAPKSLYIVSLLLLSKQNPSHEQVQKDIPNTTR